MTGQAASPSYDSGAWAGLSRRFSPYLDLTLGLVVAGLAVTSLLGSDIAAIDHRLEHPDSLSATATAVAGLALVWRRKRPVASFVAFVTCCLVVTLTGHYIGLLSVVLLFSLYSLAAHGTRRAGVLGLLSSIGVFIGLALLDVPDLRAADLAQSLALLVTAWAVGDAIRSRRHQQAGRLRVAEQEAATAREHAALAVVEERLRIARELHDVVAHHMSLIAVQAGVGAHVIRTDVTAAEQALEIIADTSRNALAQTRSMLGLLREVEGAPDGPPAQSLGDLGALLEDVRSAGVDVALTVSGTRRPLDAGVELTAYRVVQESLTNVLRHSGARNASVLVAYDADGVDIVVHDPGHRARRPSTGLVEPGGNGLVGLGERARLHGGTLESAASADGFTVRARLPSRQEAAT